MTPDNVARSGLRRPAAKAALIAAAIGIGLFLALTIAAPAWPLVPARIGLLIAILTAAGSAVAPERLRLPLLAVSTVVFFGVGVLGIFSVGILILPLGLLTGWAALVEGEPRG